MPGLLINSVQMTETDANYQSTIKYLTVPASKQTDPAFGGNNIAAIKALEDPLRREIYAKMQGSATEAFTFPDKATAVKHWNMRVAIVDSMNKMTTNPKGIDYGYFDPFKRPPVPVTPPGNRWDKGATTTFFFKAKAGVSSSDAMQQVVTGSTRGECLGAIDACFLIGARTGFNDDTAFNTLHPAGTIVLGQTLGMHTYAATDTSTVIPGDRRYMKNKDDYVTKAKANGVATPFWQGENAIYMGTIGGVPKYAGLGVPPASEDDLRKELKNAYLNDTGITPFPGDPATAIRWTVLQRAKLQ